MSDRLWLASLRTDGYAVLPQKVPVAMCDAVLDAIGDTLGIRADDPATWDRVSAEIDQVPMWNHPAQWAIRQLPELHELWAAIWERPDLWVDVNSCRFTPPTTAGRAEPLPLHFDVDPRDPAQQWYPAVVALTDAPAGHGGFRCVPSLFRDPGRWPTEWVETDHGTEYQVADPGDEIVEVPVRRGDLLIWDTHLPHGTVANRGSTPRAVFYLQMHPPGNEEQRLERVADVDAGRCPPWWRWKPGHDRLDRHEDMALTPLGERLLGRVRWEDAPSGDTGGRAGSMGA